MSNYPYRYYIFVPTIEVAAAKLLGAGIDPDAGGDRTFDNVRLRSSVLLGLETHRGCNTLATDGMRTLLLQALGSVPTAVFYRCNNPHYDGKPETLQETNSLTAKNKIGQAWSWDKAIADAKLEVIQSAVN